MPHPSQKPFERGVALLHSFWYEEAEKEFVADREGRSHLRHGPLGRGHEFVAPALGPSQCRHREAGHDGGEEGQSLRPATPIANATTSQPSSAFYYGRKATHDARATRVFASPWKQVYQRYPDDREAAAFYALSLLASEPDDDTTFANRKKAAAVLEKLFTEEPNHPGVAHYLIHSYDKPQLAELGLPAARSYAKIAPAAPHALHMPSHIFARLGLVAG